MLPTSEKLKRRLYKLMSENIKQQVAIKAPLAHHVRKYYIFEGNKLGVSRFDGSTSITEVKKHEATSFIAKEEATSVGYSKAIDELSTQLAETLSTTLLQTLEAATEESGNKVNTSGKPFSAEVFLAMIDKLAIDFKGNDPDFASLVFAGPAESLRAAFETATTQEPYKTQFETLMTRKKREYDEREARRKLVD